MSIKHESILPLPSLTALLAWPAGAQVDLLNPRGGPFGGAIETLEMSPSDPAAAYAGVGQAGLFRSLDGGVSWISPSRGWPSSPETTVKNLAAAPSREGSPHRS